MYRNNKWSNDEIDLLIELYPIKTNGELVNYFEGRTETSIYYKAKRLGLNKKYDWRYNNLSNINSRNLYNIKDKNNPNLRDVFIIYKGILNEDIGSFQKYIGNISKQQLVLIYRYYNRKNNIIINKEYFINNFIGKLLNDAKIKSAVKKKFHSYYDFIVYCYPNLELKQWEMKKLDVKTNFWDNKYNRFWCIREGLNNLINDHKIDELSESLELDNEVLYEYMSSTLLYYYTKNCIREYLDFIKYGYNKSNIYNGIRFDSSQEKQVYKFIYDNITNNIQKCFKKDGFLFINEEYNERYIPDFYIKNSDNIILIEYFGMYKIKDNNPRFKEYRERTERKINYYNSLNNIIFISLFPNDLQLSFEGVKNKLTPFIN